MQLLALIMISPSERFQQRLLALFVLIFDQFCQESCEWLLPARSLSGRFRLSLKARWSLFLYDRSLPDSPHSLLYPIQGAFWRFFTSTDTF